MLSHNPNKTYTPGEIIAIKGKRLSPAEEARLKSLLHLRQNEMKDPLYQELFGVFFYQLKARAASDQETALLIDKAQQLTRHFLKRKLGLIRNPAEFKCNETLLDPHHHLNSIHIHNNEDLLYLLPNFNAIYENLRDRDKSKRTEEDFLKNIDPTRVDVQFFGNPPMSTLGQQKFLRTLGYLKGGHPSFNCIRPTTHSSDYCGEEAICNAQDLEKYLATAINNNVRIIRIHMGETIVPHIGQNNIAALLHLLRKNKPALAGKTIRIGHGTHMSVDHMLECAQEGFYVEACLSSNKETGIIKKRKDYPLALMLLLGVKVMIGTDGGDLYYTHLTKEYAHAAKSLASFLNKIEAGGNQTIILQNQDLLLFKHLKPLFPDLYQDKSDALPVTFEDLKQIPRPRLQEKISIEALLKNMRSFKALRIPANAQPQPPKPRPQPLPSQPRIEKNIATLFDEAIAAAEPQVNDKPELANAKRKLAASLHQLKIKTCESDISDSEAQRLATSAKKLAENISKNPGSLDAVTTFNKETADFKSNWSWKIFLGAVLGAAIGVILGAIIGIGAGPGAALTALAGGAKGAALGAAFCGGLGGAGGSYFGFWHHQRQPTFAKISKAATEVHRAFCKGG